MRWELRPAGLEPLGLAFGLVQGEAVPAGLAQGADALHAAHQLEQQRDHLGTHTRNLAFMLSRRLRFTSAQCFFFLLVQ